MLSKQAFVAGITIIKKAYLGWGFDLNDEVQVNLWYSAFKNLTDERFGELINDYMAENKQPPMSIRCLTEIYIERQVKFAKIPPETALDKVRETVSECGGWQFEGRAEIYAKLKKYPELYETVKEFESTLRTMAANDPYVAERFRKAYTENLYKSAERQIINYLELPTSNNSSPLGTSALPYEV